MELPTGALVRDILALMYVLAKSGGGLALLAPHPSRSREASLDSPLRERLLKLIQESPGIPMGELMARAGLGWGTLYHHLNKLVRAGHVRTSTSGRRRLIYPVAPGVVQEEIVKTGLLRGRTALAIARLVEARPGMSILDITNALDESPRAVYYHVKRLMDAGYFVSDSHTRYHGLRATGLLRDALAITRPPERDAPAETGDALPNPDS